MKYIIMKGTYSLDPMSMIYRCVWVTQAMMLIRIILEVKGLDI